MKFISAVVASIWSLNARPKELPDAPDGLCEEIDERGKEEPDEDG
jgi:hypothetical protein